MFIEGIFPDELYQAIKTQAILCKYGGTLQDRRQDNADYVNQRYNLIKNNDEAIRFVRQCFSDIGIKKALMKRFYLSPQDELIHSLRIHREFEFTFTAPGRFQNIHIDIPPKFLSFVFYIPEHDLSEEEQRSNATILYDKRLRPCHKAQYKSNSVCIFAPHFYSYHGFSSTIDRDVLVMFYINEEHKHKWASAPSPAKPPFTSLKETIQDKLRKHPLLEYGLSQKKLLLERRKCRVNAPEGCVLVGGKGKATRALKYQLGHIQEQTENLVNGALKKLNA